MSVAPASPPMSAVNPLLPGVFRDYPVDVVGAGDAFLAICRLRQQVCNEEFGLGLPSHQGLQRDEFDPFAIHLRLTHREQLAGYVRLIALPHGLGRLSLPFTRDFADALDRELIDPDLLPASACSEISMLVLDRAYRRRPGEDRHMAGVMNGLAREPEVQRSYPSLALHLILGAIATFLVLRRSLVFFATEPRHVRRLGQLGIHFTQAGRMNEQGQAVFFATRDSLQMDLAQLRPDWRLGVRELKRALENQLG